MGAFLTGAQDGIGITMTAVVVDDQEEIGTAGGVGGATRSAGWALGSVVYSTVLANRLSQTTSKMVPAAALAAGLPERSIPTLLSALNGLSPFTDVKGLNETIFGAGTVAFREANAAAYKTVFYTTAAFGGIAVICTWFVPHLNESLETYVPRALQSRKDRKVVEGEKV